MPRRLHPNLPVCRHITAMTGLPASTVTPLQDQHLFSVAVATALRPWFSRDLLAKGHTLIRDRKIHYFTWQRRYAGLLTSDHIQATIQMAPGRGQKKFVFRDAACSQCLGTSKGTRCRHTAALALLCLREQKGKPVPLADIFPDSPWAAIGTYLHSRSRITTLPITLVPDNDAYLLTGGDCTGLALTIRLDAGAATELCSLFPRALTGELPPDPPGKPAGAMRELGQTLAELSATTTEQELNRHGARSKKQRAEQSMWHYLARLLFLHLAPGSPGVSCSREGIHHLQAPGGSKKILSLTLPREHTWELLDRLPGLGRHQEPERAEQFARVRFSKDNTGIEVIHCCRLDDGTEYLLREIADKRFGSRYQVDDRLFSLLPVPDKERLRSRPGQTGQLSLFAPQPADAETGKHGFKVMGEDMDRFLKINHNALRSGRHRVDPGILEMKIVDLPTALTIDRYEERQDWCYLAGWYELGESRVELADLLRAGTRKAKLLPGAVRLRLSGTPLSWFYELGDERIVGNGDKKGWIRLRRGEFLALTSQIGAIRQQPGKNTSGTLADYLARVEGADPSTLPAMPGHLRTYQQHGTAWLYQLYRCRLGGILADDMGLGKTHQALALIALLAENWEKVDRAGQEEEPGPGGKNVLIVCPAAVLYHWPDKQQQFFAHLGLAVYHGPGRDLDKALENRIIVTTYGVLQRDVAKLEQHCFTLVIFDEMHALKNHATASHQAALRLRADSIIGLTGTPMENRTDELAALLSICLPDLFGIKAFAGMFTKKETPRQRTRLRTLVAPFLLRRTRKQVLPDLPACSEDIRLCTLSEEQVSAYSQAVQQVRGELTLLEKGERIEDFSHVLTTIIRLKQICNHLCQLERCTDWQRFASGKWDEFTRLAEQCLAANLKVVVFSQFTSMLDIIEAWLTRQGIDHISLRGSVAAAERNKRVQRFNRVKKCRICCASLLAGGTGIDLTGAQVVIHYDRWWNPAKEEQATARVHRMGQQQPVQVYKLVCAGTLEEKIHHLIEEKRALAADLISEDDASVLKALSAGELAYLFSLSR